MSMHAAVNSASAQNTFGRLVCAFILTELCLSKDLILLSATLFHWSAGNSQSPDDSLSVIEIAKLILTILIPRSSHQSLICFDQSGTQPEIENNWRY